MACLLFAISTMASVLLTILFRSEVHGADAAGESLEAGFAESGLLEYRDHLLALWEGLDGFRQIAVGAGVL